MNQSPYFTWIYAGDGLHVSAVSLLVGWILHKRTCKGISGRTQIVGALVDFLQFAYAAITNTNIYMESPDYYSVVISGISSTIYATLLYVMYVKYKKTIEKDYDTFWIELLIILCGGIALVANPIYMSAEDKSRTDPISVMLYTSVYLDCVSILPQIYFNFRTGSKTLCVTLYVLLSTLCTFFYLYYLVTFNLNSNIDFDRLEEEGRKYTVYPEIAQLGSYALFFIFLIVFPKYEKILPLPINDVESTTGSSVDGEKPEDEEKNVPPVIIVKRPELDRQQSLLETPFLKKSLPSSLSLVSTNPEGVPKLSPFHQKMPRQHSKPNIAKIMRLTHLKRARTSASSLYILGTVSAPSTPEDEGFMMLKETALQSRQRRQQYNRRRSLPTTATMSTTTNENNSSSDKVKFQIGDDDENDDLRYESTTQRKHKKTLSFERFLAAQKLRSKQAEIDLEENNKNIFNSPNVKDPGQQKLQSKINCNVKDPGQPKILGNKDDQLNDTNDASVNKNESPKSQIETPRKVSGRRVPDASRRKSRRATMYHPGPQSPQIYTNWKMLATNFVGTGPIDVRRPSVNVLPSRDEPSIDKRRRNRIFSLA